jgi:hypothetical protein
MSVAEGWERERVCKGMNVIFDLPEGRWTVTMGIKRKLRSSTDRAPKSLVTFLHGLLVAADQASRFGDEVRLLRDFALSVCLPENPSDNSQWE